MDCSGLWLYGLLLCIFVWQDVQFPGDVFHDFLGLSRSIVCSDLLIISANCKILSRLSFCNILQGEMTLVTIMFRQIVSLVFEKARVACGLWSSHKQFDVAVSKSNPEACVPDPYWTNLRQWSQQLRTLMIWTHWGLVLRAHRLAARSPINSFLLKLFARQHKSILFCLGQGHPCEICQAYLYIFSLDECGKWLVDMHEENTEGQWFGIIGISISTLIFLRDAFVIILFSLPSTGLSYILYYPRY